MIDTLKRFFFGDGSGSTSDQADRATPPERAIAAGLPGGGTLPTAKRMYASAMVNRLTQDWIISITSADSEVLTSRIASISRARNLERDNTWMEKLLTLWENNIIGDTALRLESQVKTIGGDRDDDACDAVEYAWEESGRRENCTVTRSISRFEMLNTAVRTWKRDGGAIFRKWRGYNNPFAYALEPIEIDRLDHNFNAPTGVSGVGQNIVKFGIEYDSYMAPVAYHILSRHPGDVFAFMQGGPRYRERILADEIIPLWTRNRFGQTVGMPKVTSIMHRLNMLDKYEQAEAVAAFIASCKSGFFERTNPDGQYAAAEDSRGDLATEVQPGMIEELPPYVSYKANDPQHPTDAYSEFIKGQLRAIASGAGVPYNDLANDLENVNFSSIRQGTLDARLTYMRDQETLKEQLMTPWFEDWLFYALMAGKVEGYSVVDYDRLKDHCWQGKRWPWVDPLKDVQAAVEAINANLKSEQMVCSEMGLDLEEVYAQRQKAEEMKEEYGLEMGEMDSENNSQESVDMGMDSGNVEMNGKKNATQNRSSATTIAGRIRRTWNLLH